MIYYTGDSDYLTSHPISNLKLTYNPVFKPGDIILFFDFLKYKTQIVVEVIKTNTVKTLNKKNEVVKW